MTPTTTHTELLRWIESAIEDEHLEFKEAKNQYDTDKALRYCVAIANEGGGKLILGVTDQIPRRIVGTRAFLNPYGMQSKILDKFRMRVEIEEVVQTDGRVLIFHIPSRPIGTAYQFEGAYLMRSGEDTVPMTEDRLRHIFDEGKPNWLLRSARENVIDNDVVRLLDTQSYFDLMHIPYPENRKGVIDRFAKENFIVRTPATSFITNLGALLFAKRLLDFDGLIRKTMRVIVYDGTNKLRTRLDREALKGYAVGFEEQIDLINGLIPSNQIIGRALRTEVKMFPEVAVRELVANALIHQDFSEMLCAAYAFVKRREAELIK